MQLASIQFKGEISSLGSIKNQRVMMTVQTTNIVKTCQTAKHFREAVEKWDILEAVLSSASVVWLLEFNNAALLHLLLPASIQSSASAERALSKVKIYEEPSANFRC